MLEIGNLYLKLAGLAPDEARRLAEEVAQRLARQASGLVFATQPRRIDQLNLSISLQPDTPREQGVERIVAAILERIES